MYAVTIRGLSIQFDVEHIFDVTHITDEPIEIQKNILCRAIGMINETLQRDPDALGAQIMNADHVIKKGNFSIEPIDPED